MPTNDFLDNIVAYKKESNQLKKAYFQSIRSKIDTSQYTRYHLFKKAISKHGRLNLIAEIKKASPSKGIIREDFDVLEIAKVYCDHNAAAISVLTEDKYFLGNPQYVRKVSEQYKRPVLMKDFFIEDNQIYEASINGASAILLIVAILGNDEIKQLLSVAAALDLDCLVEVHDDEELERAIKCDAEIIGINNRNLRTFEVSMNTCRTLIPKIPKDKVIVAESGITSNADIRELMELGANAVLIGESFMREQNIGAKIDEIMEDNN